MAIIKCAHCGQSISDKAEKCVHCGATLTVVATEKSESKPHNESGAAKKGKDRIDYMHQFLVDEPLFAIKKKRLDRNKEVYRKVRSFLWWTWEILIGLVGYFILRNGQSFISVSLIAMFAALMLSVVIVFNAWFEYYPSYKYITACRLWVNSHDYDLYDYINDTYTAFIKLGNMDAAYQMIDFMSGHYYASHGERFRAYKRHLIIRGVICMMLAAWLVFGLPFLFGHAVMTTFDTSALLWMILPTVLLFGTYFVTLFCLYGRDNKFVRSIYKID